MQATVTAGRGLNRKSVQVKINNVNKMTPKAARSFSRVAFGHANGTTVQGGGKTYRCTKSGTRRII